MQQRKPLCQDLDDSKAEEVDEFAENLKAASDGLTLKPADYSAVNAALAKVSNNINIYGRKHSAAYDSDQQRRKRKNHCGSGRSRRLGSSN